MSKNFELARRIVELVRNYERQPGTTGLLWQVEALLNEAPPPEEMRSAIIDECIAAVRGESLEEPAQTDGDEGYMNAIEWSITALMELRAKRTEPQKSEGS